MRAAALFAVAAALTGCGGRPAVEPSPLQVAGEENWRRVATSADRTRLRNWRATWLRGLGSARAADASAVAREGALFDPDRALAAPIPPAGAYRCRTFKLGAKGTAAQEFTSYPWFACQIERADGVTRFSKTSGSQRQVGSIYSAGATRGVFLGSLVLGDESGAMAYGRDPNRDLAGLVERVGPARWRIVLPEPRFESQLDVVEVVPAK